MYNLIERYMNKLTIDDVNNFAIKNNIILNNEELEFTYSFIKKNWQAIITDPRILNLERYKNKYSEENFLKIEKLYKEYSMRFKSYL